MDNDGGDSQRREMSIFRHRPIYHVRSCAKLFLFNIDDADVQERVIKYSSRVLMREPNGDVQSSRDLQK